MTGLLEERVRSAVNRLIRLEEDEDERGRVVSTLSLVDPLCGEVVLSARATSLRARRDLLEAVLTSLVREVLHCGECGTSCCTRRDEDLCRVIQITES